MFLLFFLGGLKSYTFLFSFERHWSFLSAGGRHSEGRISVCFDPERELAVGSTLEKDTGGGGMDWHCGDPRVWTGLVVPGIGGDVKELPEQRLGMG